MLTITDVRNPDGTLAGWTYLRDRVARYVAGGSR